MDRRIDDVIRDKCDNLMGKGELQEKKNYSWSGGVVVVENERETKKIL